MEVEEEKKVVIEMLNSEFCKQWMRLKLLRLSKCTKASVDMRKFGNELLKNAIHDEHIHERIWRTYTSSLTTGENESDDLAFAYGNRSAILIHLCKYEECIKDIDRAVAIIKDNVFCIKLMIRKAKCLHALKSDESLNILKEAEYLTKKVVDSTIKKSLEESLKETKTLLQKPVKLNVSEEDEKFKSINSLMDKHQINDFSSVKIQSDVKYGRHLVANKDLNPGDVIFIEKPYIQCPNLYNVHGFCSHCFIICWANIPCNNCSWAMFCSEKCKTEAWQQYHDIECSVWASAKQPGDGTPQKLALRSLVIALKEYGSLENIKAEMKAMDECTDIGKGFIHNGKIQPSGFKTLCSLSKDISEESLSKIHKEPLVKMLKSFGSNTPIFGNNFDHSNVDSYKTNEDVILLGTLFLRLSKISQVNGRQIWNHRYYPCPNNPGVVICPLDRQCCTAGSYIAPVTSLLNHNCHPNARVCYGINNSIIVYATQPIKKGKQIFDCYTFQVHEEDMAKRQKIHSYIYNFVCDCVACKKNLPYRLFASGLCKLQLNNATPADIALSLDYREVILSSFPKVRTNYNEKIIDYIRKGIEKALKITPDQPSVNVITLMFCLQRAYEQIYGISLNAPRDCNII